MMSFREAATAPTSDSHGPIAYHGRLPSRGGVFPFISWLYGRLSSSQVGIISNAISEAEKSGKSLGPAIADTYTDSLGRHAAMTWSIKATVQDNYSRGRVLHDLQSDLDAILTSHVEPTGQFSPQPQRYTLFPAAGPMTSPTPTFPVPVAASTSARGTATA